MKVHRTQVGTNTVAIANGSVKGSTHTGCGGQQIILSHSSIESQYLHLNSRLVTVGASVVSGQKIGTVGNTGTCTTGPHLHFGINASDKQVDPRNYISFPPKVN